MKDENNAKTSEECMYYLGKEDDILNMKKGTVHLHILHD